MFWLPNNLISLPQKPTWFRQISTWTCRYHIRVCLLKRTGEPVSHLQPFGTPLSISHSSHSASLKYESGVLGRHKCTQSLFSVLLPHLFVSPHWCIKMFIEELEFDISIHLTAFDYKFCEGRKKPLKNGKLHACLPIRMVSALCLKEPPKPNNSTALLSMSFMSFHPVLTWKFLHAVMIFLSATQSSSVTTKNWIFQGKN